MLSKACSILLLMSFVSLFSRAVIALFCAAIFSFIATISVATVLYCSMVANVPSIQFFAFCSSPLVYSLSSSIKSSRALSFDCIVPIVLFILANSLLTFAFAFSSCSRISTLVLLNCSASALFDASASLTAFSRASSTDAIFSSAVAISSSSFVAVDCNLVM